MSGTLPQQDPGAAATARICLFLGSTIVTVGGRDWTGRDLVTAGALSGRWRTLEADLIQGLVCQQRWAPPREQVRAALREFRYSRRLISADDFLDWLRKRGLTQDELRDVIERRLARGHDSQAGVPDGAEPRPVPPAAIRRRALAALPAEAVATGAVHDCAMWLVDRVLCLTEAPAQEAEPSQVELVLNRERELLVSDVITESDDDRRARARLMLAANGAYDARVAEVCSAQAISKLLRRQALGWLRFDLIGFICPSAGAAAEIAALLREGTPPGLISELSGVPPGETSLYLDEAPLAIQGWLASAGPGAVIGPVDEQGTHRTWLVRARHSPRPEDPSIAGKARAQIVEDHMRRRRAGRLKLHERD